MRLSTAACAVAMAGFSVAAGAAHPDTPVAAARADPAAELHDFNARILAGPTATGAMEHWCSVHDLAAEPRVRALPDRSAYVEPGIERRALLQVSADERVGYRRVKLMCGDRLFSVAENWYVPGRLTPAMNALLDSTDTPFGTAVKPLNPSRRTIGVDVLWDGEGAIPDALLVHRALVLDGQGQPISLVVETYQRGVLP